MAHMWFVNKHPQKNLRVDSCQATIFTMLVEEVRMPGIPTGVAAHLMVTGISVIRTYYAAADESEAAMADAFAEGRKFCEMTLTCCCCAALAPTDANNYRDLQQLVDNLNSDKHIETAKKVWEGLKKASAAAENAKRPPTQEEMKQMYEAAQARAAIQPGSAEEEAAAKAELAKVREELLAGKKVEPQPNNP